MEILRKYQVARELGFIDGVPEKYEYDNAKLRSRILEAYKARFCPAVDQTDSSSRPSSPSRRKPNSATPSRTVTLVGKETPSDSLVQELREIIAGLEDRVSDLEDRNASLREKCDISSRDCHEMNQRYTTMLEERDRLAEQVLRMKEMVASENSAGRILQRVSDPAQSSDLKLEIYKQQIMMLNAELAKLKSSTSI
jgi:hypothetical protein